LQGDLFNSGIRPAVNVGISVSRVGSAAQTGAMKSVAGKLKLELAQYRELAAFAQFGSELDKATMEQLERGKRMTELLKQLQYHPLPEWKEIASMWAVNNGYMNDIPVPSVVRFELELHEYIESNAKKLVERLSNGKKLDDDTNEELKKIVEKFKKVFSE
jgi:F-type H+-transporting ATPase subunit alpha